MSRRFQKVSELATNFDHIRIPLSSKQRNSLKKIYPYYGAQNIIDYVDDYLFDGEYLLVAEDGANLVGQNANVCNIANGKFWVNNHAHILKGKNGNHTKYLYYYLNLLDFKPFVTGSAQPKLTKENLESIPINAHSLNEQEKIVSILDSLDRKIELNIKINTELEAMSKLIYDYWFVQFDFPDKNGKPYKSSGGKMVWSEELKREIPEKWEAGTLQNIAEIVRGVSYKKNEIKDEQDENTVPILRATNITGNVIDLENMVYVSEKNVDSRQILNKYDILLTMSSGSKDHIGKNGFYYYEDKISYVAFCAKIVARKEFLYYVYSYTQSSYMFTTIKNECLGTNINNLNNTMVMGFKIILPPNPIIELFNQKVSCSYEKIGINLKENQELTKLRDWLLPMLMNGQVIVKDLNDKQN